MRNNDLNTFFPRQPKQVYKKETKLKPRCIAVRDSSIFVALQRLESREERRIKKKALKTALSANLRLYLCTPPNGSVRHACLFAANEERRKS